MMGGGYTVPARRSTCMGNGPRGKSPYLAPGAVNARSPD
jgi:hypothetical protein